MTCHIGLSSAHGTVIVSDSQGSTTTEESHGLQKQFAGPDFLLGAAGSVMILQDLFQELSDLGSSISASNAEATILRILEERVRPSALAQLDLVLATAHPSGATLQRYLPGLFTRFGRRQHGVFIGSGADFAAKAVRRDTKSGIQRPTSSIEDLLITAENYSDAANDSLTVDDVFVVGFLIGDRTYLMGDAQIIPAHAPTAVKAEWGQIASRFQEIKAVVQTIRGEINNAHRAFAGISIGTVSAKEVQAIDDSRTAIIMIRTDLQLKLLSYFQWYDGLIGRP